MTPHSTWQIEVDRETPAAWSTMLDLFSDANLYQTWSYGSVRWRPENLSHLVLRKGGEVAAMAQLRIIRPAHLKFGIAYLRWGPLCHRCGKDTDPETVWHMACALREEYVVKRRLLLRILPNAFVGSPCAAVIQSAFRGFAAESAAASNTYRTFVVDLARPLEELRTSFHRTWRRNLSRSEKNNLKVIAGSGTGEFRVCCEIYRQMRKRKTFETTVDVEEFGRIQQDLAECHRMRVLICEQDGVPIAGLATSALGDSAIDIVAATSDAGLDCQAAYLLHWNMIQWLKENSIRWYNLGGIDPEGNPGVYQYKRGLSGADLIQISPLVACESIVSSAIVRAGLAVQRKLRRSMGTSHLLRALKKTAAKS
jgi:hypothetical protein